jgi:hypothetical protein
MTRAQRGPVPLSPAIAEAARPAELPATATQLYGVATIAEQLTELLDRARDGYAPQSLSGPDPVYVSLDQAAAAAHDLAISLHSALDAIAKY